MIDAQGEILYIGKAKELKKRVTSYTQAERLGYRLQQMVAKIDRIETTSTNTEAEALLLEANLIKEHQPRYNILLKDDKSYPYILIDEHDYPRIQKYRGSKNKKGKYFGPFPSAGAVNKAITDIQKAFLIRPCSDNYFSNRNRPCLEYQIKRCSAPCVKKISEDAYQKLVKEACDFLSGKGRSIQQKLVKRMEEASQEQDYETAAQYRDRIKALNAIQAKQDIYVNCLTDADLIGFARFKHMSIMLIHIYRDGRLFGHHAVFPKRAEEIEDQEIIAHFLGQYYQRHTAPKEILLSIKFNEAPMFETMLTTIAKHKVTLSTPQKGAKKALMDTVQKQAEEALKKELERTLKQQDLLAELGEFFHLPSRPKRVEIYDNSHIMGTDQIGVMVTANDEGFDKSSYRKFKIKTTTLTPGDDYAMMQEVLTRRLKYITDAPDSTPDLLLIDGGKGHRSAVMAVFKTLGLPIIPFVCIAKGPDRNAGEEQFFSHDGKSYQLPKHSPLMHFLQRLRDEAHRFAIGSHRQNRDKKMHQSLLDTIPGIGAKRKKALLHHFGSIAAIKTATVEELKNVEGINAEMAEVIREYL